MIEVTLEEAWFKRKPKVSHLKILILVSYDDTIGRKLFFVR
jgi:hypothetical protein